MNCKEHLLSLGVEKALQVMKERGCETIAVYVGLLTGIQPGSYGIMNGGLLFDDETWSLLESTEYTGERTQ